MDNAVNKSGSIGRLLVVLLMLMVVVVSGTFAWLTYSSKESALVLTIGDINDTQIKLSPYQVTGNIVPSSTYTNGVYSEVEVTKGNNNSTSFALFYKINELDTNLIDKGLSYTIVNTQSGKTVKTGKFSDLIDTSKSLPDKVIILDTNTDDTLSANTSTFYRVYLWVDSSVGNQTDIQNSNLDVELNGSIGSVKINGTNTYASTLSTTINDASIEESKVYRYQWYYSDSNTTKDGTPITGATSGSYKVGKNLVGKYIYVVVTTSSGKTLSDVTDGGNNTTETVAKKTLNVASLTYSSLTKTYDSLTSAPSGFGVTATTTSGLVSGDVVTVNYTGAAYNNANVVNASSIAVSGMSISGDDADNYALSATSYTKSGAKITAKAINLGTHSDTYNGITSYTRTFSTGVNSENLTLTYKPNVKTVGDYTYTTSAATGTYLVAKADGTGKASNYSISAGGTFTINTKTLNVDSFTYSPLTKVYDGTLSAPTGFGVTATTTSGLISGDVVTVFYLGARYNSADVSDATTILVSGMGLSGADSANYELSSMSYEKTGASITKETNSISVTTPQSWSTTFSTTTQTKTITAATGGQGTVTYAIQSQKNASGSAVTYFSISGTTLTMAANTPVSGSSYTVVIRATAVGNTNYNSGYKDITMTVTVGKASISPTVSMSGYTYGGTKSTPSVSGNSGSGTVTYYYNTTNSNSVGTAWTSVLSSRTLNAGTYYMYAEVGETSNYNGATTSAVSFTIAKAPNPISVTTPQSWSATYSTSGQTKTITEATGGQGTVTYAIQSQKNASGAAVTYFSISGTTLTMAASTPVSGSSYTVVIRATAAGNTNYNSGYKDITMTVTVIDGVSPNTPTITRSDYNTFTYTATDDVGVTGYFISSSDSKPSSTDNGWTTSTSYDVSEAVTYYVWAKDAAGNVSDIYASISAYDVSRSQGTGTTLTTKFEGSSGTEFTSSTVALAGTPLYATVTANTGYNTPIIQYSHNGSGGAVTGVNVTLSGNASLTSSATVNTYTIRYYLGANLLGTSSHTYGVSKNLTSWDTLEGYVTDSYTGWIFGGWTDDDQSAVYRYDDEDSVINLTSVNKATVNLYAVYERNVYFYGNMATATGEVTSTSVDVQYYNVGNEISYLDSPSIPSLTSWTAQGWSNAEHGYEASDGSNRLFSGSKIYLPAAFNNNLYAIYKKNYRVRYNEVDGSGGNIDYELYLSTCQPQSSYIWLAELRDAPDGSIGIGWNTDPDATTALYESGGRFSIPYTDASTEIDLYGIYKARIGAPTITRTDYNTFSYSATGASAYYVSTSSTAPSVGTSTASSTFALDRWTTATSTGNLTLSAGTYYVWAKDATTGGELSSTYGSIGAYTVTRSVGTGTSLTTRYDSTSSSTGTAFTSNTVVLSGTNVWASASANAGYGSVVLKRGGSSVTNPSYASVTSAVTIASSATVCTPTASVSATLGDVTHTNASGQTVVDTANAITATVTVGNLCSGSVSSYAYQLTTSTSCPSTGYTAGSNNTYTTVAPSSGTYYVCTKVTASNGQSVIAKSNAITLQLGLGDTLMEDGLISDTLVGGLYRYSGTYDAVKNNYMCFGTSTTSKCSFSNTHGGNNVYSYRVIGVDSAGRTKVIMTQTLGRFENDTAPYASQNQSHWELWPKLNGTSYLTNTSYLESGWSDKIYTNEWKAAKTNKKIYGGEYSGDYMVSIQTTETTFSKKIGLMYIEDYFYATSLTEKIDDEDRKASWIHWTLNDPNIDYTSATKYQHEWTLTDYGRWYNDSGATDWDATYAIRYYGTINNYYAMGFYVRPVFFLNSSVQYVSGNGSMTSPYIVN